METSQCDRTEGAGCRQRDPGWLLEWVGWKNETVSLVILETENPKDEPPCWGERWAGSAYLGTTVQSSSFMTPATCPESESPSACLERGHRWRLTPGELWSSGHYLEMLALLGGSIFSLRSTPTAVIMNNIFLFYHKGQFGESKYVKGCNFFIYCVQKMLHLQLHLSIPLLFLITKGFHSFWLKF